MRKLNLIITVAFIFLCILNVSSQEFVSIEYECLDQSLFFESANDSFYYISCNNGVAVIDTLETPCNEGFYEEDGVRIKAWYYFDIDKEDNTNVHFDKIAIEENSLQNGFGSKHFALHKSTLWFYFPGLDNSIERIAFQVKDISGKGINFGTDLGQAPGYYTNLADLAVHDFSGVSVEYSDDMLLISGSPERIFIGGDHLLVSKVLINEPSTSIEKQAELSFQLYPNPAINQLHLSRNNTEAATVIISDIQGRENTSFVWLGSKMTLGLDNIAPGVYLLSVIEPDGNINHKLFAKQ